MSRNRDKKSFAVGYDYGYGEGDQLDFDESDAERILDKAKEKGVVLNYDTGRGHVLWFEGLPGPALRKVRNQITKLLA
jgi:hypothetical protein